METDYSSSPPNSPDSIDLENPPVNTDNIVIQKDNIDCIYEKEMDIQLVEIKNQFIQNSPNIETTMSYHYLDNNSPLTMSCDNSDGEDDGHGGFKEITSDDIINSLDKYFDDPDTQISNELDILITYMKGQKNLFIESYIVSKNKLNMLMIPSILITIAVTIFAPIFQNEPWSIGLIAGLNAIAAMNIATLNYLKLETSTQTFYNTATHFDKLETSLEFVSSKLIFVDNTKDKTKIIFDKFQEVETKIQEIKEWNQLFIPREIRRIFPIICHINIFSFIKRIESNKQLLISKFKDVKNEIKYIVSRPNTRYNKNRIECRLKLLNQQKEKIKEELFHYRNAYSYVDELFNIEIKNAQNYQYCIFFRNSHNETCNSKNPIVDRYIHSLISAR
jgi:hypothetical protein